jgi:hypothetical protein
MPRYIFLTVLFVLTRTSTYLEAQTRDSADQALGLESLLNTKISTAAKYAQTVAEAASAVTVISSEDIDRYGYGFLEATGHRRGLGISVANGRERTLLAASRAGLVGAVSHGRRYSPAPAVRMALATAEVRQRAQGDAATRSRPPGRLEERPNDPDVLHGAR